MEMSITLFVLILTVLSVTAAPIKRDIAKVPKFKIFSLKSTRLLSATPNGDVHAKASDRDDPSTDFYLRTHGHDALRVSYESVLYPGKFLVIDEETGQIRVDVPEDGNEKLLQIPHQRAIGFETLRSEKNMDCHVAFDKYGSVTQDPGICHPDIGDLRHSSIRVIDAQL